MLSDPCLPACPCLPAPPGGNYRAVWALNKNYPHVKTYVRAHDITHAKNLELAGATGDRGPGFGFVV